MDHAPAERCHISLRARRIDDRFGEMDHAPAERCHDWSDREADLSDGGEMDHAPAERCHSQQPTLDSLLGRAKWTMRLRSVATAYFGLNLSSIRRAKWTIRLRSVATCRPSCPSAAALPGEMDHPPAERCHEPRFTMIWKKPHGEMGPCACGALPHGVNRMQGRTPRPVLPGAGVSGAWKGMGCSKIPQPSQPL